MKGSGQGAWIALALAAGCVHTQKVGDQKPGRQEQGEKSSQGQGSSHASTPRVITHEGRPPVAASPSALMNPGSAKVIQEALQKKGYLKEASGELDAPTAAALRRFQHDADLAETGAPDRETLRHLGVDPSRVYQSVSGGKQANAGQEQSGKATPR